eukprot:SAG31_NODE_1161_length_9593_cov_3.825629_2_plen_110_part_00
MRNVYINWSLVYIVPRHYIVYTSSSSTDRYSYMYPGTVHWYSMRTGMERDLFWKTRTAAPLVTLQPYPQLQLLSAETQLHFKNVRLYQVASSVKESPPYCEHTVDHTKL